MRTARRRAGSNGLVAASLFAGVGGSSVGYRLAGFRVAYANEIDRLAREKYRRNADKLTDVDDRDVRKVKGTEILRHAGGQLDVLDASPPCQDWSTAGGRNLGGENAKLYWEAVRLVGETRPRAFCIENVSGLTMGAAYGRSQALFDRLRGHGYRVAAREIDGQWLGVPQQRRRILVIGLREDIEVEPSACFPRRRAAPATIRDAIPDAARLVRTAPPGPLESTAGASPSRGRGAGRRRRSRRGASRTSAWTGSGSRRATAESASRHSTT